MSCRRLSRLRSFGLFVVLLASVCAVNSAGAQEPNAAQGAAAPTPPPAALGEEKIRQALTMPATIEFIETPLADVVAFLKDAYNIPIEVEAAALDEVGLSPDVPVTRNLHEVSLRTALRVILRDLGLTYLVDDEVLLITTQEEAAQRPVTRVYPVTPLLPINATDADDLAQLVRETVLRRGARGGLQPTVATYGPLLIVRDTEEAHDEVEKFLSRLATGLNAAVRKVNP